MRIARTRLRSFRNLASSQTEWGAGLNLLTGLNGVGKTNVIEALHILTGWGTLSGAHAADVATWGCGEAASLAAAVEGERSAVIEAKLSSRASLRIDNKVCRWLDLRSCVQSLTFLPADMALIEGGPVTRRRFLDALCALYFPLYAWKLGEYRKIVRHRRYLLQNRRSPHVTERPMEDLAVWIWDCRAEVVASLRRELDGWGDLLPLSCSIQLKRGGSCGIDDFNEDFSRSCEMNAERERASGVPLVGPHRDDLILTVSGRAASSVLSRGQRRRTALALIMAAASSIQIRYRAAPILLLDEVTSELDDAGRKILFECLLRSGWQVFAATAEKLSPDFDCALWQVEAGVLTRI